MRDNTDIPGLLLLKLLSHENTKRVLSVYFLSGLVQHFETIGIKSIVAGNGESISALSEVEGNNHEEPDSLVIHCICRLVLEDEDVLVYANDTNVVVLLVVHFRDLRSHLVVLVWAGNEFIDVSKINMQLISRKSKLLLSFHLITGCDTVAKSNGKGK